MIEPRPVILIGAARSGTKFLRDVLAAGAGGAAVPYDVNYVWRYGAEGTEHDVLDPASLTDKRKNFIRRTLRSLAKAGPGDVLIEKTVASTLRVAFVDAVFPDARYVHLVRDGRDVAESAMRQWRKPPDWRSLFIKVRQIPLANASYIAWFGGNFIRGIISGRKGGHVWGPRFPGIDQLAEDAPLAEVCAQQWLESVTRARRDLARLPGADSRVFTIRYEDLIAGPSALEELVGALGLPDSSGILACYRRNISPSPAKPWLDLPQDEISTLHRVMGPVLSELEYEI
ncbi:sulfotransferase [Thioalkalivibrio sp. XN8]|uniref:sulfotransferase family protein n=1 Tax=Thioalkalivibrio sp. XN8 TaxID=2712863 RepID=UPI0013E9EAE1|nr:sulfotransferase [Thioalkalivibrio sp. XN8]NGP53789.1 sulfotransferase [Thioalkalivibrio sp. XN8]